METNQRILDRKPDVMENVRKSFGSLKSKKQTQKAMEEIDEGYD